MAEYASLIVPVTAPSEIDRLDGFVKLEQGADASPYRSYLTKSQSVQYLAHLAFGTAI